MRSAPLILMLIAIALAGFLAFDHTSAQQADPAKAAECPVAVCDVVEVFNKYDRARLPVCWKNKAITRELDRKSPDFTFFAEVETWELFREFEDFASNRLK